MALQAAFKTALAEYLWFLWRHGLLSAIMTFAKPHDNGLGQLSSWREISEMQCSRR
jgi:hypothetical protein